MHHEGGDKVPNAIFRGATVGVFARFEKGSAEPFGIATCWQSKAIGPFRRASALPQRFNQAALCVAKPLPNWVACVCLRRQKVMSILTPTKRCAMFTAHHIVVY